jgi:hypothetical protein
MKLACANGHLYSRWDTGREEDSFNIETTQDGFDLSPTSHYRNWPRPLSPRQLATNCFLRSLKPREELALFIAERGRWYMENDYPGSHALLDLLEAQALWPENRLFHTMRRNCETGLYRLQHACFRYTT